MRQYEAAIIGVVMGLLYGIVLWASYDALATASFILYKNIHLLPLATTASVIILAFVCLFSYPLWAGRLEQAIVYSITKDDDEEDEDE
jgi:hypothetical protein